MRRARDVRVILHGQAFHYLEWGHRGAPPLLLLHGAAQTAHSFDEVAPHLARDHDVVALDLRGHGDSAWSPRYRREDFMRDVLAVTEHLGWRQPTLIAMSLGGLVALTTAATHPRRVAGLVIVDVVPTIAPRGRDAVREQLATLDFPSFADAVAHAQAFNPRRSIENIRDRLRHALRREPDGRWRYKFDPRIGGEVASDLERLWHRMRHLRCPALLVRGAESPILTAEGAARFRATVPRSTVATVAAAGHSVMGDNPAGFLAAVGQFLRRHGL